MHILIHKNKEIYTQITIGIKKKGDFIYRYDKSYEEVRDHLSSTLGRGASNYEEFLRNENYLYMLKKLV